MLSQMEIVLARRTLIDIDTLHARVVHVASVLGCSHMEDRRGLAGVIDDDVVDVVIVYYVRDVASLSFCLNSLL